MTSAEGGGVDFDPVKALRVVEKYLALEAIRDVGAIGQSRNSIGELTVPVRIVRGEQDIVGREELGHIAQGLLFRLAGHEYPAASHVFRRLRLQQRRVKGPE